MRILAIETSCDDTGIAVLESDKYGQPKILADLVSSQVKIHAFWGGVVPTLAKREHQKNLTLLLKQALAEAKLLHLHRHPERSEESSSLSGKKSPAFAGDFSPRSRSAQNDNLRMVLLRESELLKKLIPFLKKYQKPDIDLIAVTVGPGLEPALWVGVNFARALSYFWNFPIIPVNHIEAHISANWLPRSVIPAKAGIQKKNWIPGQTRDDNKKITKFPVVSLVVSGGHTQLILIRNFGNYKILGGTRDDAAGEAFDKVAKMLNLGYPGGPIISQIAQSADVGRRRGDVRRPKIELPRPMLNSNDYDFSFSGLKTAVLYLVKKLTPAQLKKLTPIICAQFQQAVVDVLVAKTIRAAKKFSAKTVLLSGGVAANDSLRDTLSLTTNHLSLNFSVPQKNYCTDNAAMVAFTAYLKIKKLYPERNRRVKTNGWQMIKANANLKIA